jgi:hypothetical protein
MNQGLPVTPQHGAIMALWGQEVVIIRATSHLLGEGSEALSAGVGSLAPTLAACVIGQAPHLSETQFP